jgi:predicted esterase
VLGEVRRLPGASGWRLAAVQALHRFYARDNMTVIGSWMTRQDRDLAIADNLAYVDRVLEALADGPVVFLGFSQGVAMAYRAALFGRRPAAGVIALGGDIPPDVKTMPPPRPWPPVLIGVGEAETWYSPAKVQTDLAFLDAVGIRYTLVRYRGGHEWTDEFRSAASVWLKDVKEMEAVKKSSHEDRGRT